MKKTIFTAAVIVVSAFAFTGCSSAVQDRGSGAGTEADIFKDTSDVILYRNADRIPNVAYFCAGDYGWAATLSTGEKSPSLVRFSEYDSVCDPDGTIQR